MTRAARVAAAPRAAVARGGRARGAAPRPDRRGAAAGAGTALRLAKDPPERVGLSSLTGAFASGGSSSARAGSQTVALHGKQQWHQSARRCRFQAKAAASLTGRCVGAKVGSGLYGVRERRSGGVRTSQTSSNRRESHRGDTQAVGPRHASGARAAEQLPAADSRRAEIGTVRLDDGARPPSAGARGRKLGRGRDWPGRSVRGNPSDRRREPLRRNRHLDATRRECRSGCDETCRDVSKRWECRSRSSRLATATSACENRCAASIRTRTGATGNSESPRGSPHMR